MPSLKHTELYRPCPSPLPRRRLPGAQRLRCDRPQGAPLLSRLLSPGTKQRSDCSVHPQGPRIFSYTAFLQLHSSLLNLPSLYPHMGKNIHVLTHTQHQSLRVTKICRNTSPWFMHLETQQYTQVLGKWCRQKGGQRTKKKSEI